MTPPPATPALVISFSPPHEAEIVLNSAAARALAELIRRGEGEMAGDRTADPKPYERVLDAVRVAATAGGSVAGEGSAAVGAAGSAASAGKVVLGLDDDQRTLTITGAPEHLAVLADVVQDLADYPDPDTHLHIEYFDGHYYLAESQIALVMRTVVP